MPTFSAQFALHASRPIPRSRGTDHEPAARPRRRATIHL